MTAFHEIRFPETISLGSSGGVQRVTDIVTLRSGHEQRNTIWSKSRRTYDAGLGVRNLDDLYRVIVFFEARRGQLHGFRWKDWSDYKSGSPTSSVTPTDVLIGVGDGVETQFQLRKIYSDDFGSYTRDINKPVEGTVRVSLSSAETTEFTVNTQTGLITMNSAPLAGVQVRAGFEFDVPVRFNQDSLIVNVEQFNVGSIPNIDIVELRV